MAEAAPTLADKVTSLVQNYRTTIGTPLTAVAELILEHENRLNNHQQQLEAIASSLSRQGDDSLRKEPPKPATAEGMVPPPRQLTDRCRVVMNLAAIEAQKLGHTFIAPEHVLIGLLMEGQNLGCAVLKELNFSNTPREARRVLRDLLALADQT